MWVTKQVYKQRNENGDNRLLEKLFVLFIQNWKLNANRWQQPFLKSRKLAGQNSMKNRRIYIQTAKMVNNLQTEQNCSTYSVVFKLVKRHHKPPVLLYFSGFPTLLAESLRPFLDKSGKRKRLCRHLQVPLICRSSSFLDESEEFYTG